MKKVLLKELADIKLCIPSLAKEKTDGQIKWLVPSTLSLYNEIKGYLYTSEYNPEDDIKVRKHDIIMKRVLPTGINYIEEDIEDAYAYNNLFIIRTKENVNSDYLAAYLDENISEFVLLHAKGSVAPSIGRKDLMEMEIYLPDEAKQNAIGKYWLIYNKKKRLENKLTSLEQKKNREIFRKIRIQNGGIL